MRLAKLAAIVIAALVLCLVGFILWPLPQSMRNPAPVPGLVIADRHGIALRDTRAPDGSRGGWVSLAEVDPRLIQTFLAVEDRRFREHHGIDLRSVMRAARDNIAAGGIVSGASTVTMQVARLLRPTPRTWTGKARQALWAVRLDTQLGKSQILETYLNRVPLGQGAVGVEAAARLYFGASASQVSLGQAAMLAALARAPSRDNPLVDVSRARTRRDAVLERMHALGYASRDAVDRAATEPVLSRRNGGRFQAPHFTTRLLLWQVAGASPADHQLATFQGGRPPAAPRVTGTWRTTLDLELQRELESEVRHTVSNLRDKGARHAAIVVLDNPSGDILAWVGSPDFHADSTGQVDMVASPRQPGSTLKPFLYAMAFDRGWTAASVLPDVPRTYSTTTGPYRPQNYDRRFRGPVRIREALASSYNVPAVELTDRLGAAPLLGTLRNAGFASLDRSAEHYGLGLSLGNGEVTLLELANAYRGLANGGVWTPYRWNLEAPAAEARAGRRFASTGAAALILDILSDPIARIGGFGTETALDLPFPAATKTGTSRHFTDNWAVAAAGRFTIAVWVGNFSGQPMQAVSGITGAGPLLHRAALVTARRHAPGWLPSPEQVGAVALPVCAVSGMRVTPGCARVIEWFLPGTEPTAEDTWTVGGRVVLPPEYAEWLAMEEHEGVALAATDAARSDQVAGERRILSPANGDEYEFSPAVDARYATLALSATPGTDGLPPAWYVDGRPHQNPRWRIETGRHVIRAVWQDGGEDEVVVVVR